MRYPIKDKFWGWRMDPFEVFAYWDSKENQPQLTLTLTLTGLLVAFNFRLQISISGCSFCSQLMNCWNWWQLGTSRFHLPFPSLKIDLKAYYM